MYAVTVGSHGSHHYVCNPHSWTYPSLGHPEIYRVLSKCKSSWVSSASLKTVAKPWKPCRNHPGYRTILWYRQPLSYLLPPIPGLTGGTNFVFNKKYEGKKICIDVIQASTDHPPSVQTDRVGHCRLCNSIPGDD